jgi:hypothetical protein
LPCPQGCWLGVGGSGSRPEAAADVTDLGGVAAKEKAVFPLLAVRTTP